MSIFIAGGGSLTATNLPSAFVEAVLLLLQAQNRWNMQATDLTLKVVTLTFEPSWIALHISLPAHALAATSSSNAILYNSDYFFVDAYNSFNPGANGTLPSSTITLSSAVVSLAQSLYIAERKYFEGFWYTKINHDGSELSIDSKLPIFLKPALRGLNLEVIDYLP